MFTKNYFGKKTALGMWVALFCLLSPVTCSLLFAQQIETLDLSTSVVHPITARLGNSTLIQLPSEPTATNVGDPAVWMVEKQERLVSIHPIQAGARDTTLAIVTRQGILNFVVHLAPYSEPFTQSVRVMNIIDDSKPLPAQTSGSQETLADTIIREIRIAQNYYALKQVHSPDLGNLEQFTQLRDTGNDHHTCSLLQAFRFRDTRHLVLHFITQNKTPDPLSFDQRRTTVSVADTLFAPIAVSLGKITLKPKGSAENFIVLDGSNGLSPRNKFNILLVEAFPNTIAVPSSSVERPASSAAKPLLP